VAHLLAIVLLVGAVDSANPATIAPALYFAAGKQARTTLAGFIAGVFATNLVAGVVLTLGPGRALMALVPRPGEHTRHLLELAGSGVTFALAAGLWLARKHTAEHISRRIEQVDRSSLVVGAAITAVELPTAIPYFAVLAVVVESGRSLPVQVMLLAIFNAVFAAPLLAILAARSLAGAQAQLRLESLRAAIDRRLALLVPTLVLLVAVALFALGAGGVLDD
jgi:cytochrome c biogenesis protein CcdA